VDGVLVPERDVSVEPADREPSVSARCSIHRAELVDAPAIQRLQHLCYRSEAVLYDDWTIPPLTQTLSGLVAEFATHRILVARLGEEGEEIVGSVRGRLDSGVCHVGRLVVHPAARRRGVGSRLMAAIEVEFARAARFEVFTGHLSEDNIRLYRRLGYADSRTVAVSPRLSLVHLQKPGMATFGASPT